MPHEPASSPAVPADATVSRRTLLIAGALAGGGWLAGCASPARQQLRSGRLPLQAGQLALNGWIKLSVDGTVTAVIARSEMGQGVLTGLMMLVAEELDCGWAAMRFEYAPVDRLYGNIAAVAEGVPFRPDDDGLFARSVRWAAHHLARELGFMMTGGSTSLKDLWQPMREAAAATRATLVQAVARHWSVPLSQVTLSEGRFSAAGGQTMPLADAVRLLGADTEPAASYTLKSPAQFRLIGQRVPRVDTPAKVRGSAMFAGDVRRPGMLFAAVRLSPVRGGSVRSLDAASVAAAKAVPGVAGVVTVEPAHGSSGGVAVVADGWWRARRALEALKPQFDEGPAAGASSVQIAEQLMRTARSERGFGYWSHGDVQQALQSSARQLQAEYSVPYLAHTTMEPMTCTVEFLGDRATVWASTQVPGFARRAAARALGLDAERVDIVMTYLGCGFGRRLEVDFVAQAAQVARQFPGKAVQLIWSREDDVRHDFYRPACAARLQAGLDASGAIAAWDHVSASQAITPGFLRRTAGLPGGGPDKTTAEGAFDQPYRFPAVRVGHVTVDLPVPVGYWRSVGHSHQAFFTESFIDECAHAAGADPLAYRLGLLRDRPQHRRVLERAASEAGWGQRLPDAPDGARVARGIALHQSFGSVVAQVAEVSLGADGAIRVHRIVCAIDCGLPVHPLLIEQQAEGSVALALSAALYGGIDIEGGRIRQGNFNDVPALRLSQMPQVQTHIVPSTAPPQGVGEPMVPPVAPAVANALFALDGRRRRSLPLQPRT